MPRQRPPGTLPPAAVVSTPATPTRRAIARLATEIGPRASRAATAKPASTSPDDPNALVRKMLRLPRWLVAKLEQSAAYENRSWTAEVITRLMDSYGVRDGSAGRR